MAREYDPSDRLLVRVDTVKRGGSVFYAAWCKEHGLIDTAFTESGAGVIIGQHVASRHPGRQIKKV